MCSPSRAALLTGRYQTRSGIYPGVFEPNDLKGKIKDHEDYLCVSNLYIHVTHKVHAASTISSLYVHPSCQRDINFATVDFPGHPMRITS